MPEKILKTFDVHFLQILDENGNEDKKLMPQLSQQQIKQMYEWMILSRAFDEIALKLQREGRLLTYASLLGQEAAQIGSASALKQQDWLFPNYRQHGAMMLRGVPPELQYAYWAGDERGMRFPDGANVAPVAIPVSTQIPHAVGFAWAAKLQKSNIVTLCFLGDGATSKGDFHEGMNFAGVMRAPVVFVCENNQYAISVPRSKQTAAETIAQKAIAYGFSGVQVDGNDVFAVFKSVQEAVERARAGGGPTLIEAFTYRLSDHTTADDATRYRTSEEVEQWKKKDPVLRLEKFMMAKGILTEEGKQKIIASAKARVEEAVRKAEALPPPKPEDMFMHIYADMPWNLREQMTSLLKRLQPATGPATAAGEVEVGS